MAVYQVWALDASFAKAAIVTRWLKLDYSLVLNGLGSASLTLAGNDPVIPSLALMQYLSLVRDGTVVFIGTLQAEGWTAAQEAPKGDEYALDAYDLAWYLLARTLPRPSGQDFNERSGAADDVAKAYVRNECGPLAPSARKFADLYVQADAGACASVTKLWLGGTLLEHLVRIANEKKFWWRVVPHLDGNGNVDGGEFRTAYPLWGVDRTLNTANELVFSFDRQNVLKMSYRHDVTQHANYAYMLGPGDGRDQKTVEVEDATARAAYKRREVWVNANNTTDAGLQSEGNAVLQEKRPYEAMTVQPVATAVSPANLGDKVTLLDRRYGRSFRMDGIITSMTYNVARSGAETVALGMVKAW